MIPQDLSHYVRLYENHISLELCKSTVESLKKINWEEHSFYNVKNNEKVKFENELSISYEDVPEKDEINKSIWFALEQYILKDLSDFHLWFDGWNGYSSIRFNKYDPSTKMKIHCDHIQSLFDGMIKGIPILTILGSLNDDYEGGELIMFNGKKMNFPAGSVLVFPSNFMFPHEVKPVKSGVRYSYVSWSW